MNLETLEEIQLEIALKEDDISKAEMAFLKLYKEYTPYLYSVVNNALKAMNISDSVLLNSTVNNTFIKFYENPLEYNNPELAKNDACFKAWLAKVAKNELFDLLKSNRSKEHEAIEGLDDLTCFQQDEDFSVVEESVNVKTLNSALQGISDEHRGILLTLFMYDQKGKKTPSDVLDMICSRFGTTRENIRAIKSRNIKKIKEYFNKVKPEMGKSNGK